MTPIVVDSSAIVGMVLGEGESPRLSRALDAAGSRAMSAFNVLETSVVLRRVFGEAADPLLDRFLREARIVTCPLDASLLTLAREAWGRYGRSRHPAKLNLGDCCAYATAQGLGRPLLCKGDDFPLTDLPLVRW